MKASFQLKNVEQQQATLTITMPLRDWKNLADTIDSKWPGWEFRGAIRDMLHGANKQFTTEQRLRDDRS